MQLKSIAECSKGRFLQYFQPSLSYHSSLKSLFCLFLSGRLRQSFTVCEARTVPLLFALWEVSYAS